MDWKIVHISSLNEGELQNVAKEVTFTVSKTLNGEIAERAGRVELSSPNGAFIQYSNLTKSDVVGWVKGSLGQSFIDEIEASIDEELAQTKTNSIGLPWN